MAVVGVELPVRDLDDAPVDVWEQGLIDTAKGTPVELGGARRIVSVTEVAGPEEEFGIRVQGDDLGMQGDAWAEQDAKERGVVGRTHPLEADVAAHLGEGHFGEVGIEAKAAAVPPFVGVGEGIEVRRAELAIEGSLRPGYGKEEREEEQGEKSAVQAGTTDGKSIHSGKSLYSKRGSVTACWSIS